MRRSLTAAACLALAACAESEQVTIKGGLATLPGARYDYGPNVRAEKTRSASLEQAVANAEPRPDEDVDVTQGEPLRVQDADGNVTLISRSPRHVLYHLIRTLDTGEDELLFEQVLSRALKAEYASRGLEPWDAVDFIKQNQKHVRALVAVMPLGEQTPGLLLQPIGKNRFRLTANPTAAAELRYKHAEFILEQGVFRLLIIK